jgi:quercetin dioxygenase-like cupin family protein
VPGHQPRPHAHSHEQIVYIIAGKVRFHLGGAVYVLGAEELLVIPPDVEHWAEVIGDDPVLNIDVLSPRRP